MGLDLTFAIGDYDRVRPLRDGEVEAEGVSLTFTDARGPPRDTFERVVETREFDLAEMSLSTFVIWRAMGDCPLVGIPAFPSRFFRHASIFVRDDAGIDEPADLRGKRVGVPEYQMTAATMTRGMLANEYGVAPEDVAWRTAREEKIPVALTPGTDVERVAEDDEELVETFERGGLDALVSTLMPDLRKDAVRRLFPDFKAVEREYFEETGIYPIMHTVVLHEDVYDDHPWVPGAVYEALEDAKDLAIERLYTNRALPVSLPWLLDHVEETRRTFGCDFWPYGFERNRPALDALVQYSREQGLSDRAVDPEELFVDDLLDT